MTFRDLAAKCHPRYFMYIDHSQGVHIFPQISEAEKHLPHATPRHTPVSPFNVTAPVPVWKVPVPEACSQHRSPMVAWDAGIFSCDANLVKIS